MTGAEIYGAGHVDWRSRIRADRRRDDLNDVLRQLVRLTEDLGDLRDELDPDSHHHVELTLAQIGRRVERLAGVADGAARDLDRLVSSS